MSISDAPKCNAKSKRTGKKCRNAAVTDSTKCRMHGGKSAKGFSSPRYVDGSRSKYLAHLPESKQERYEQNAKFIDKPTVEEEINLTTVHLQETIQCLNDSSLFDNWESIRGVVEEIKKVWFFIPTEKNPEPPVSMEDLFNHIDRLFAHNKQAFKTWNNIHALTEKMRGLQETNSKIRLNQVKEDAELGNIVPVAVFRQFVFEVSKALELSPEEIRRTQFHALQVAFDALPKIIKEPKQLNK